MGPTLGPSGADRAPVGPMFTPMNFAIWGTLPLQMKHVIQHVYTVLQNDSSNNREIKTAQAISFWSHLCCSKVIAGELQVFCSGMIPYNRFMLKPIFYRLWIMMKRYFVKWAALLQKWLFLGVENCLHNAQNRNMHRYSQDQYRYGKFLRNCGTETTLTDLFRKWRRLSEFTNGRCYGGTFPIIPSIPFSNDTILVPASIRFTITPVSEHRCLLIMFPEEMSFICQITQSKPVGHVVFPKPGYKVIVLYKC